MSLYILCKVRPSVTPRRHTGVEVILSVTMRDEREGQNFDSFDNFHIKFSYVLNIKKKKRRLTFVTYKTREICMANEHVEDELRRRHF